MSLPTSFFIGKGGGGGVKFDDYGISSSDISSLTSVVVAGSTLITQGTAVGKRSLSSVLLDRDGVAYDPANSRIVTSTYTDGTSPNQQDTLKPVYFYPLNNMGWGAVSSTSHVSSDSHPEADGTSGGGLINKLGGQHYVDSNGTKVVCNSYQYTQSCQGGANPYSKIIYKNTSNNPSNYYALVSYRNPISSSSAVRFNTEVDGTAGLAVQVGKDQDGSGTGWPGQPGYIHARRIDSSGSINYHETNPTAQGDQQNTHGHSNRGAFLGGITIGASTYSYYFIQYNNYSNGADGYRLVRYYYNTASASAISVSLGTHQNKNVQENGGYTTTGNQVWPYAFFSDYQGTATDAGSYGSIHYVDMSGTWSSSGFPLYTIETNSDKKYISRIGGTTAAPIYAMLSNAQLEIRPFNVSTRSFGSTIATASVYSSDRVNGIWPVPNTNRLLVSHWNGVQLFEAA
jgi:hypothetical protein